MLRDFLALGKHSAAYLCCITLENRSMKWCLECSKEYEDDEVEPIQEPDGSLYYLCKVVCIPAVDDAWEQLQGVISEGIER